MDRLFPVLPDLLTTFNNYYERRFASSHPLNMNSISTSRLPDRTLGNLAIAGSLFLHVGLFAFFSSWQWDATISEKAPPKIIHINFITAPSSLPSAETPNATKHASIPPSRPMTTQPNSKIRLTPRMPTLSTPTMPTIKMARQMIRSHRKSIKPSLAQPASSVNTQLFPAVTLVSTRAAGQSKALPLKNPVMQAKFSDTPVTHSQTAFLMNAQKPETHSIHPMTDPVQSRSDTSALLSKATAQIPKQHASPKINEPRLAALPRELSQNLQTDRDASDDDLNGLRGLFTGKVRQQIANAKYYPRIARRRGMEGQPIIAFTLGKQGQLTKVDLVQTSGYQLLDQAALKAVHQAAPYPAIPIELRTDIFQFKLPISFILK